MCLSNVDGTDRMHLIFEDNDDGTAATLRVSHPNENPMSVSGFVYEDDGYIDLSRFAGGLPEHPAVWLQSHVDADGLDLAATNDCLIKLYYGGDGEARTLNYVTGDFHSDDKAIPIAASNIGVSTNTFAPRLILDQGSTTTDSPKLYAWIAEYLKLPSVRHVWRFFVDLDATAQRGSRTTESVLTTLKEIEQPSSGGKVQVTFKEPGESQIYVMALPPSPTWNIAVGGQAPDPRNAIDRTGTVEMVLVELIA